MIKLDEFLMGRDKTHPLSKEQTTNAASLLAAINYIRGVYGKPMVVSSGYRPGSFNTNAGGATRSAHLSCEAVDIRDTDGEFRKWCLANIPELEKAGLYLEDPSFTPTWIHLQTRKTSQRIFKPY